MNGIHGLSRRRTIKKRRPRDVGLAVARNILVRSLRRANLHHGLSGYPCVIGFVLNNPGNFDTFIQAARKLLRTLSRSNDDIRYEVLRWDRDKSTRRRDTDAKISGTLALNDRVFGFATDADAFPALFRLAADGIVDLLPVDLAAVKTAVRAVGIRSLPDDVLVEVVGEPLTLLSAMIKPGRNAQFVLRRLKQIQREAPAETAPRLKSRKPTLDDLHGLGEAAVWGRELAKDLNDYRAGLLPWSDVDRGVLVSGPTGTGKTTFAQALARTCNVPIHIHSLARWQAGGYLNDLLRMMRNAFDEARDAAPCILFVDELDSFGDRDDLDDRNATTSVRSSTLSLNVSTVSKVVKGLSSSAPLISLT